MDDEKLTLADLREAIALRCEAINLDLEGNRSVGAVRGLLMDYKPREKVSDLLAELEAYEDPELLFPHWPRCSCCGYAFQFADEPCVIIDENCPCVAVIDNEWKDDDVVACVVCAARGAKALTMMVKAANDAAFSLGLTMTGEDDANVLSYAITDGNAKLDHESEQKIARAIDNLVSAAVELAEPSPEKK